MYDHLVGEVIEKQPARIVLRVQGVGYELKVAMSTSSALTVGKSVTLWTILNVVDGFPTLVGFTTRAERELAKKLLSVAGVGPAICLAILSIYSPRQVVSAIRGGDHALLKKAKGVGAKIAERLCLELRDHLDELELGDRPSERAQLPRTHEDALLALVTLGYSEREARDKLHKLAGAMQGASTEDLIKAVLRG